MQFLKNKFKKLKIKNFFSKNDIEQLNLMIQEKEKLLLNAEKNISMLKKKNTILEKKLESNQEELTIYINKMFEQQEKERIINSIVNSIRQSLNLKDVLEKSTEEIRKLLKYETIIISLKNLDSQNLSFTEATISKNNNSRLIMEFEPNNEMYKKLTIDRNIILSKDIIYKKDDFKNVEILEKANISNYIIVPIFFEDNFLGVMFAAGDNIRFTLSEIEILEDFASQIAIAIEHAQLYSEAQKHIKLKDEFIASMSHELRTPLNAVIGFSDLLNVSAKNLTKKQINYLQNISMSGKHLLRLINEILDLSKIESGNWRLKYENFPHELLIKEVVMVLEGMAKKKDLSINIELCSKEINADSKIFRQIMYNLVNNAIKFTPSKGEILVKSQIKNDFLLIEIQDNGIGISPKDASKIFEQFAQADSSHTKKQEGTGLGLTLAKKFVNLHGGKIDFTSKEGVGSKFWFTLPLKKSPITIQEEVKSK